MDEVRAGHVRRIEIEDQEMILSESKGLSTAGRGSFKLLAPSPALLRSAPPPAVREKGEPSYSAAARAGVWFSNAAASFATLVPSKKRGLTVPHSRTALPKVKSRKSSGVRNSCSTSS